jgi:hypothetical protein
MTPADDAMEPGHKAGRTGHSERKGVPGDSGGPATEADDGARDRRRFLTRGLATGAAALGAWTLASAQPAHAATDGDMILGRNNTAGERTALFMDAHPFSLPGFYTESAGQGAAIEGDSTGGGPGVLGRTESGTGVSNPGVVGQAPSDFGVGVQGDSPGATSTQVGVKGTAAGPKGVGVQGTGFKGVEGTSGNYGVYGAGFFGVYGLSPVGAGVFGDSSAGAVPGVLAGNQVSGGIALSVHGFPQFSTAGKATVKAGASKVTLTVANVVASDSVLATAQGGSLSVKNATAAASKITITLSGKAPSPVTVSYLVIRT